ncbi:MAG: radical SAM protein [Solirubrobacterales bacterium]|nr:radical SAM protein [Solirubrobacterales bacterium]
MLSVSRLLTGTVGPQDALRYGRVSERGPAHLLHFSRDKKPVVVWNATRRCNLHCAHCYSDSRDRFYPGELTTREGRHLITDLAAFGAPTLLLSGGEPLMRPDLLELARAAREAGLRTVLSTNGTLLDAAAAREVAEAGFSYVGVSIDGIGPLHDKLRGKRGAFDQALRGVQAASAAGLRTGLRFTLHALNRPDLGAIFELAERERVDRLCVYHLAYAGRGERLRRFDLEPDETRRAVEEIFDRAEDLARRGIGLEVLTVDNPADNVLLLMRVRRTQPERAAEVERLLRWNGGNQSGIAVACVDPVGRVHPDQFSWEVTVGHVRASPFGEIWSSANPMLRRYRRRPRRLRGRCASCRFYALCNGGLRARAVSATGDFAAPDPACYLSDAEVLH